MLGMDDAYQGLAHGHAKTYPKVGSQLWHPAADWSRRWYFGPAHVAGGSTEAPYGLPSTAHELRERIRKFNGTGRLHWEENSPALATGLWALDFIACRHFRTPVPASMWYHLKDRAPSPAADETPAQ